MVQKLIWCFLKILFKIKSNLFYNHLLLIHNHNYSMWTKVVPFPPSSLYISFKTIYFHNIIISYLIFMKFSALNAEINIVFSSYNLQIILFLLSLKNLFKNKVKFFHQILLYNHIKLWRQEFPLCLNHRCLQIKVRKNFMKILR